MATQSRTNTTVLAVDSLLDVVMGATDFLSGKRRQDPLLDKVRKVWEAGRIFAQYEDSTIHWPLVLDFKKKPRYAEFKIHLPVGLFPGKIMMCKPLLDSALNADCEIYVRRGKVVVRAYTGNIPDRLKFRREFGEVIRKYDLALPVGISRAGLEIHPLTAAQPHIIFGGPTGAGKSTVLRSLLAAIHIGYTPRHVQLALGDLKGFNEFKLFEHSPFTAMKASNPGAELEAMITWLNAELDARAKLLRPTRYVDIMQYNRNVPEQNRLPFILLVIDEFAQVPLYIRGNNKGEKAQREELERANTIYRLLQMGRSHAINCILCTQRLTVDGIPGGIKANAEGRIALRTTSGIDSQAILGHDGAAYIDAVPGRAIYRGKGRERVVQIPYLSTADCEEIVAEAIAKWPRAKAKEQTYVIMP